MAFEELACFATASGMSEWFGCVFHANSLVALGLFFFLMIIFIGGWSIQNGIEVGFTVGGFFAFIISTFMFLLGWISITNVLFPIIIMLVGIFMLIISNQRT